MNHRVKNLFAIASGVVALSGRSAESAKDLTRSIQSRLAALARAHDLTLMTGGATERSKAHLRDLVHTILSPYEDQDGRITIEGPDLECGSSVSTSMALLLHEFATNSVKYGALSTPGGRVTVRWRIGDNLDLAWAESGGPTLDGPAAHEGFGSSLVDMTARAMGGKIERDWRADGLTIRVCIPSSHLTS
jgi:two-component sensor histidine kinase